MLSSSGIVATFKQECVSRRNDQRPILAKLDYVGWVEEILEFNYGVFNIIMGLCNWVKANYIGNSAIVKRDEYDFTLVNSNSLIPISDQSFIFPIHVEQMFFLLIQRKKKWNVVLCKYPRGKEVTRGVDFDPIDLDIFRIENDDSYIGLQAHFQFLR